MSHCESLDGSECRAVVLRPGESNLRLFVPKPDEWINSNQRLHRMVKANRVKAWRAAAAESVPPGWAFDHPVRIVAHVWKDRAGRYDPNNLSTTTKACVDGFVDAGLLVDDDWEHVTGPDHRHGGKGAPGIIFSFTKAPFGAEIRPIDGKIESAPEVLETPPEA